MFTGIIESQGIIREIVDRGTNRSFWVESSISSQFKIDQSISHNGVCLTVEQVQNDKHKVTAIPETLLKSNLGSCNIGDSLNLERSMMMNGRLDGHIVQGHVDSTGICLERKESKGSWEFRIGFPPAFSQLVVEKGSICLNGVSLTIFNVDLERFSVAIIPYTFEHTNINAVEVGSRVNLEFDLIGKYIARFVEVQKVVSKD
jgi:riboflavin synthase